MSEQSPAGVGEEDEDDSQHNMNDLYTPDKNPFYKSGGAVPRRRDSIASNTSGRCKVKRKHRKSKFGGDVHQGDAEEISKCLEHLRKNF